MEKLRLCLLIIILLYCRPSEAVSWVPLHAEDEFSTRFPLVEVTPSPSQKVDPGPLDVSLHFKYSSFEYSGVILRAFLLFETKTYIYLGSDYRYFYGNGEMTINNHFYLPDQLFNKRVTSLYLVLLYTVDPINDQKRIITKWEYFLNEK